MPRYVFTAYYQSQAGKIIDVPLETTNGDDCHEDLQAAMDSVSGQVPVIEGFPPVGIMIMLDDNQPVAEQKRKKLFDDED